MLGRRLLSVVCLTAIIGYGWEASLVYRAHRFADSIDLPSIENAASLAPRNAGYHDLLCRNLLFISQKPAQAVDECIQATKLDPYSSIYWLDMAQAYYSAGNRPATGYAIKRALAVDPTTPDTSWNAANFYLIQGDTANALKQFHIVLKENPSLAPAVLNICWQTMGDVGRIQSTFPPNPDVYLDFIRLLLATGKADGAHHVWLALMQLNVDLDYHHALFYVDNLLHEENVTQAKMIWDQLQSRSKALQAYSQAGNLVADGQFSQEILNSGFAWRYVPNPQITVLLDNAESHAGTRSLQVAYSSNGGDAGIYQLVPVEPNHLYHFSAWVKSDDIQTANGPMLALLDTNNNQILTASEQCMGTTPWHQVNTDVLTGPNTYLVKITVIRQPDSTRIQGKFWFDDVVLRPRKK